jgi:hypothetical protein
VQAQKDAVQLYREQSAVQERETQEVIGLRCNGSEMQDLLRLGYCHLLFLTGRGLLSKNHLSIGILPRQPPSTVLSCPPVHHHRREGALHHNDLACQSFA